ACAQGTIRATSSTGINPRTAQCTPPPETLASSRNSECSNGRLRQDGVVSPRLKENADSRYDHSDRLRTLCHTPHVIERFSPFPYFNEHQNQCSCELPTSYLLLH